MLQWMTAHVNSRVTDSTACNYDVNANVDDGSCLLPPQEPVTTVMRQQLSMMIHVVG